MDGRLLDSRSVVHHPRLAEICTFVPTDEFCYSDASSRLRAIDGAAESRDT